MRKLSSIAILAVALVSCNTSGPGTAGDPLSYVSTLVGSQSDFTLSTGNTYPAVARPWGMNFWTPQTGKMGDGWTYTYDARKIRGFKQTHQPSPWINDYGQFSLMPVTGSPVFDEESRASWFSHKAEVAKPHYYRTFLADHNVTAEITATERAAMLRFTYPQTDSAYVVVDAFDGGSSVTVIPEENKVVGFTTKNSGGVPANFRNYFIIQFDHPFEYTAAVSDGRIDDDSLSATATHAGAIVGFKTTRGEQVNARVASSFISLEQAELNLAGELADMDFDQVKDCGARCWNDILSRIEVTDDNVDHLRTFYSCLYRSVLFPRAFYEIDSKGKPIHYSPYNGRVCEGYMFTDTGFWDTFRALFPLLNLVYPSMNQKMQQGLANAYKESGFLPEWASPGHRDCMVGNNSASVVADAYLKGVDCGDIETLWAAVVNGTRNVHPEISSTGRRGHEYYNRLGYIPCDVDINESAARTLEYAYDDWCIYRLGRKLGKSTNELAPYAERARNYRNLFDKESRLMRGRNADGSFETPFNPVQWGGAFTEGNSWHYTWSVFHDPKGLMTLMGGKDRFNQMLDSVFAMPPVFDESRYNFVIHEIREMQIMDMGNYAHGNQPIQHMAYLYNYSGQPWKTQYRVRQVMDRMYSAAPDGYCGDEDNGQTSAWYVFSALGFYPVCPGSDQYVLGSPLFSHATIKLENGNTVDIQAPGNNASTPYVAGLKINGKDHGKNFVTHGQLTAGATLSYTMAEEPDTRRGTRPDDAPYSFSDEIR